MYIKNQFGVMHWALNFMLHWALNFMLHWALSQGKITFIPINKIVSFSLGLEQYVCVSA